MNERRKEPRIYSDLSANIRVLACDSRLQGRILDLTSAGLALMSPERLEAGAAVSVTYKGVVILAEVVYCSVSSDGYRVGVQVDQALATGNVTVAEVEAELRSLSVAPPAEVPVLAHATAACA